MFVIHFFLHLISWMLGSIIGLIMFGFWVWCLYDCATRRYRDPSKKPIWLGVLLLSFPLGLFVLGAMAYVIFGREERLSF